MGYRVKRVGGVCVGVVSTGGVVEVVSFRFGFPHLLSSCYGSELLAVKRGDFFFIENAFEDFPYSQFNRA